MHLPFSTLSATTAATMTKKMTVDTTSKLLKTSMIEVTVMDIEKGEPGAKFKQGPNTGSNKCKIFLRLQRYGPLRQRFDCKSAFRKKFGCGLCCDLEC